MTEKQAKKLMIRSSQTALGYIELAKMQNEKGLDSKVMREMAIKSLQEFSDNDEAIDAMYDADMREDEEYERTVPL